MAITSLSQLIREQMCSEIRVNELTDGKLAVATPLTFGDGDSCRIIVTPESDGTCTITDGGHVLALAFMEGVDLLSEGHVDRLRRLATLYGAEESGGELKMTSGRRELGDAIYALTQACIEASRLTDLPPESARQRKEFSKKFKQSVERVVPAGKFTKDWFDPNTDPTGIYKVDYQVIGKSVSWLVVGVGSPAKCWKSASAIQHHRAFKLPAKTVFAYNDSVVKDSAAYAALVDNADWQFSLNTERKQFESFLKIEVSK